MIKGKIFEKCKKYFEEYLFGFDQNHLRTSILTGKIHLTNVNIRPDKVNELFAKKNLPIALKAGLISELSVKVNLFQLFSESLKIVVEDMLFIVGPNITHISQDQDFENDINAPYDDQNPLNNLLKMHHRVYEQRKQEHEVEKQHRQEERKKKQAKQKEKAKKKKELKEPPMKVIVNLLGGLKLEIKRVHFRYEDDYFQHHKPFAFGVMVESITMDNSDTDWIFESLSSMNFSRGKPFNPKTSNKELNIKNVKVYWNSMSEMFVPTSLWEQTRQLKFQIFEAIDASFLKEIMTDINANVHPNLIRDILKFQEFLEMFTYAKDLKKYRPLIKVQTFIEQQAYTPQQKKKRLIVIRDWFQLVLWYVRLRKLAKGYTPYKLLEVEAQYQQQNLQNCVMKVKRASLMNYEHYQGSSDEEDFKDPNQLNSARTEDLDAMAQYEKQKFDIQNTQVLRDMLTGFKFSLRLEGIKAKVFTKKKIVKQHQEMPRLEFSLDMLTVIAGIQGQNLTAKVLLQEIKLLDFFKREPMRSFSRAQNNMSRGNLQDQSRMQRDSSFTRVGQNQNGQPRGTLAGMVGQVFDRSQNTSQAYNTPDKGKMRITDLIYGSNPSQDRSNLNSRQVPYDFFALELPDPSMAHHKTRETLTISDILNNSTHSRATSQQQYGNKSTNRGQSSNQQQQNFLTDNYAMTTPSRSSKIIKAQKFQQSPTKGIERTNIMNNHYLNQRSETFVDDSLESVDKRCFILMCGKSPTIDPFLTVDISANIFDEPGLKKKINLNICIDQIIIEYCNEILKSITDLGLQYKLAFNFADMKKAKGPSKKNKRRGLQTTIQYYALFYTLKKQLLKRAYNVKEEAILNYVKKFYIEKEKNKTKNDIMKEVREKQFKTIVKIKELDKQLSDVNFDVGLVLKNLYLGINGDRDDPFVSNQTLLEFGIENQGVYLNKQDFRCKVSVFGISVTTLNSFEMLFIFANNMKKVGAMYKENLAVLTSITAYKDFIKNIHKNLEKKRQQKQHEEEQEMIRKGSQPKIVVMQNDSSRGNTNRQGNQSSFKEENQKNIQFRQPGINNDVGNQNNRNKVNFNDQQQDFQAERNLLQMSGGNNSRPPQQSNQRMGNNQIFLMNQNTIPPERQVVKQNPQILDQDQPKQHNINNPILNRQQTGYNREQQNSYSDSYTRGGVNAPAGQQLQGAQNQINNKSSMAQYNNMPPGGQNSNRQQQQQQQQHHHNVNVQQQIVYERNSSHEDDDSNDDSYKGSSDSINNGNQQWNQQNQNSNKNSQRHNSGSDNFAMGGMRQRANVQSNQNAADFDMPPRKR